MKSKLRFTVLSTALVLATLTGCKKDEDNNNNQLTQVLKSIGIKDAKTLYISTTSILKSLKSIKEESNKLYKVTAAGEVAEVTYMDDKGDTIKNALKPMGIYNLSDNYIIATFSTNQGETKMYLVNKSDGIVYSADDLPEVNKTDNTNYSPSQKDAAGNIYYLSNTNGN